jgi:hypothetical protein
MLTFNPGGITIDGSSLLTHLEALARGDQFRKGHDTIPPKRISDYEGAIQQRLKEISEKDTGRFVLEAVGRTGKKLMVIPYTEADVKLLGPRNAYAKPTDDPASSPAGVHYYKGNFDDPATPRDERYDKQQRIRWGFEKPVYGTGEGSNVELHYTDSLWKVGACCSSVPGGNAGDLPDEVFLHEIVHSLRFLQGKSNQIPTEGTARLYNNEEEFLAILVTNIYMSEKKAPLLRAHHFNHTPQKAPRDTSAGFLRDPEVLQLVKKYATEADGLGPKLQTVTTVTFNPIAEYLNNRDKYGG